MLQLLSEKTSNDKSDIPAKKSKELGASKQPQKKVHFEEEPDNSEVEDTDTVQNNNSDTTGGEEEKTPLPSEINGETCILLIQKISSQTIKY